MKLRTILCVDDQKLVHSLEDEILAPYVANGTQVMHAYNGAEALRCLVAASDVDLILLDINMPLLNGLAFLEQKQRTMYAKVPVIVLSNEGDRQDEIAHAVSLGADRVLPKPFGYEDLDACIRSIVVERGQAS
jgi:DNA-binding response OmpR family regulator